MGKFQFDAMMDESPSETGVVLNIKHRFIVEFIAEHPQDKFSLEDLSVGLNLRRDLKSWNNWRMAESFMQMMKSLNKITTKSVKLELAPSRMKLNKAHADRRWQAGNTTV